MWEQAASGFLFQVGDVVVHKSSLSQSKQAHRLVIVSRILEQCSGGIQRLYGVRAYLQAGDFALRESTRVEMFAAPLHECELVIAPAEEPKDKKQA